MPSDLSGGIAPRPSRTIERMKILVFMFLFMMLASLSAGCLIRTNSRNSG